VLDPRRPTLRYRLDKGERLGVAWLSLGSVAVAELAARSGSDAIVIDMQHGLWDRQALENAIGVIPPSVPVLVRVAENTPSAIGQALDAGAEGVIVPLVETAEQARAAVAATRYPPQGVRGVSVSQRGNRYGTVPDYFARANEEITVVVQIESRAGVAAADEIAAVQGVDGLFIGPSDLAAGYGHLGDVAHPEVQRAIARVHAAAQAAGKPTGILSPVEADARRYLDLGVRMVAVGSDLGVLRMQTQSLCDRYRDPTLAPIAAQY